MAAQQSYRRLMDKIVERAKSSVTARRIRLNGHGEHPLAGHEVTLHGTAARRHDLSVALSDAQRDTLCEMLENERQAAFHDFLALLEDAITLDDVQILQKGVDIGAAREETLHFDFICRVEDDAWPDQDE